MEANVKKKEKMHIICKTTKKAHTKKPTKKVKKKKQQSKLTNEIHKKNQSWEKKTKMY